MAASSADDHLTVGGDANVVVSADPEHAACTSLHVPARWLLDGGTQWMPLSAAAKHPHHSGEAPVPSGCVQPAPLSSSPTSQRKVSCRSVGGDGM